MKKLLSTILCFAMCFGLCVSTFTTHKAHADVAAYNPCVYSPEFPNAYILQNEPLKMSKADSIKQIVSATVFVEEEYDFNAEGQLAITSSRLLSESEVLDIGLENFIDIESAKQNAISESMKEHRATNARGSLTITFSGTYYKSGNSVTCDLTGNASWSPSVFPSTDGENNPNWGSDYMGVVWSGGFTATSASIEALGTNSSFKPPVLVMCDSIPNAGRVWEFTEYWSVNPMGQNILLYLKSINVDVTLSKNNLTNGSAEAVLKYIHTYQSAKGSISITASSNGIGSGFVLNNVEKQWSIVCTVTGIPC